MGHDISAKDSNPTQMDGVANSTNFKIKGIAVTKEVRQSEIKQKHTSKPAAAAAAAAVHKRRQARRASGTLSKCMTIFAKIQKVVACVATDAHGRVKNCKITKALHECYEDNGYDDVTQ